MRLSLSTQQAVCLLSGLRYTTDSIKPGTGPRSGACVLCTMVPQAVMHSASDSLWFSFSMLFQITPLTMSCVDKESLPDVPLILPSDFGIIDNKPEHQNTGPNSVLPHCMLTPQICRVYCWVQITLHAGHPIFVACKFFATPCLHTKHLPELGPGQTVSNCCQSSCRAGP